MKDFIRHHSPDYLYSLLGSAYSVAHPAKRSRLFYPIDGAWRVIGRGERYYTLKDKIGRGSVEMQREKFSRFNDREFCAVEQGDVVVDVGAFIGEFSMQASQIAKKVYAIEPDPNTYRCLDLQTSRRNNVVAVNELPYEEITNISFKSATDGTESSILDVDEGDYEVVEMTAKPLDDILSNLDVHHVDFLKLDAEGAEPEVLGGINETRVNKFAIDVGEERAGERTEEDVRKILEGRGYKCKIIDDKNNDPILFAKFDPNNDT